MRPSLAPPLLQSPVIPPPKWIAADSVHIRVPPNCCGCLFHPPLPPDWRVPPFGCLEDVDCFDAAFFGIPLRAFLRIIGISSPPEGRGERVVQPSCSLEASQQLSPRPQDRPSTSPSRGEFAIILHIVYVGLGTYEVSSYYTCYIQLLYSTIIIHVHVSRLDLLGPAGSICMSIGGGAAISQPAVFRVARG